jgi:hypothetical protein
VKIDCSDCQMYRSEHCDDCLVTSLLGPLSTEVEIEDELDPPLQALAGAGLIPVLRFRPKDAPEPPPEGEVSRTG